MGLFDKLKGKASGGIAPYPAFDEKRLLDRLEQEATEAFRRFFSKGPYIYEYESPDEEERMYAAYRNMPPEQLRSRAEAGDARAQFEYGLFLSEKGDAYNEQALYWFRKSADAGNAEGALYTGIGLEHGLGCTRDVQAAIRYYEQAAAGGQGCEASDHLYHLYIDLTSGQEKTDVRTLERKLLWLLSCAWYYQDDPEHGPELNLIAALTLDLLVMLGNQAAFELGLENIEDFAKNGESWKQAYDYALMGLSCIKKAEAGGAHEDLEPGDEPMTEGRFLCSIGELALQSGEPYALDVLEMAIRRGSDYAVAVSAYDRIKQILQQRVEDSARAQDPLWRSYYNRAVNAYNDAVRRGKTREQAHSLVGLFSLLWFGVGVPMNRAEAVSLLKRAADLHYPPAAKMLSVIRVNPDGTYTTVQS